jgi:hypothetical protein
MYFPYFRGKQYELITIRENVKLMKKSGIIPIIEPVKSNLSPLSRAVSAIVETGSDFILAANPRHGELIDNPEPFQKFVDGELQGCANLHLGYIVDSSSTVAEIEGFLTKYPKYKIAIFHHGFPSGKELALSVTKFDNVVMHLFVDGYSGKLYQRHFNKKKRLLIRDGFKQRKKNSEYPETEHFSDLHITYSDEGMDGFGDFLIVGDDYMDIGGPAYAVAIHLTYLDDEENMFIWHFLSDRTDSPVDPAGKFLEALEKMIAKVDADESAYQSSACDEFRDLYRRRHFPGLGYVKKLSMQHHIEVMSAYLKDKTE